MERDRPPETTPQKELQLENTTTGTIYRLHKLLEAKREGFTLCPEDLYLQAPSADVGYEEYIDNGCHGGSVERHRMSLPNSLVKILLIKGEHRSGITVSIALPNGYSSSLPFQEGMQLLRDTNQETEQNTLSPVITARITDLLAQSGGILHLDETGIGLVMPDCKPLLASAADPYTNPVTHGRARTSITSEYKPKNYSLKNGQVTLLDAIQSKDEIKVKFYLDDETETDWEPLEAISFSTAKTEKELIQKQLFIAATRLITNQTAGQAPDKTSMEILRQYSSQPLIYTVADLSPRHPSDSFITASLDKKGRMSNPHPNTVQFDPGSSFASSFYLNIDSVENHHNTVWLHDTQARLATPLSRAALSLTMNSGFARQYIHVLDYLKSQD